VRDPALAVGRLLTPVGPAAGLDRLGPPRRLEAAAVRAKRSWTRAAQTGPVSAGLGL
jgi:hypothetical protein